MPRGPRRILAAGCGEHVAADGSTSMGIWPDGLAGVEQVGDAGLAGGGADLLGGVDQSALGGHVGDGDELDRPLPSSSVAAGRDGQLAGLVVGDDLDHGAGARGDLQERDDVAGVLGAGGQDAVAGLEGEAVERHVPGAGGVLDHRDLVGAAADELGDGGVGVLDLLGCGFGGLVAADLGLAAQVGDDGVGHLASAAAPRRRC